MARRRTRRGAQVHPPAGPVEAHFEVTGELDDYSAEALRLEIEEMVRRLGATITTLRLETAGDEPSG